MTHTNDGQQSSEFDTYADDYEKLIADPWRDRFAGDSIYFHERKLAVLLDCLGRRFRRDPAELSWLDLGCGRGDLLRLGHRKFRSASGCDISQESLKFCREFPVALQASVETLPFDDASFDVVTAACVFHHVALEDRAALTASAYRVLKPGGVFCIFEHNPYNPVTRIVVQRSPVDVNAILLYPRETVSLLRAAAFAVDPVHYFLFLPAAARKIVGAERSIRWLPLGGQYAAFGRR
jgi:ubiquinone/menaquinone biosynthesis C-methylase UbiE